MRSDMEIWKAIRQDMLVHGLVPRDVTRHSGEPELRCRLPAGGDRRRSRRQSRGRSAVGARTPAGNSPRHRVPEGTGVPRARSAHRTACPARPIKPLRTRLLAPTTPHNPLRPNSRRPAIRSRGSGAEPWPPSRAPAAGRWVALLRHQRRTFPSSRHGARTLE